MNARTSYVCPKCHAESFNPNDAKHYYCGACHTFAADLRDEIVTEFAHLTTQILTRKDCYSLAALTLMDSPNNDKARLVHASVVNLLEPGTRTGHAWTEFPAIGTYEDRSEGPIIVVSDYSQVDERARFMPQDEYYKLLQPVDIRRFTRDEMIAMAQRYGNDGPWPDEPEPGK